MAATSDSPGSSRRFARLHPSPRFEETWTPANGAREYADTELVTLAGKSIYVLHDLKTLRIDPATKIDVIVSGRSHIPKIDVKGGLLYLNPGSAGRRRFKLPTTFATLEITPEGMRPKIHDLGEA